MSHCVFALVLTSLTAFADGDDLTVYQVAAVKAGKDADAHVRLALWCEAHGFLAERDRELAEALRLNPNHADARGLSGMIRVEGRWASPDEVAAKAVADPARQARHAAYDALRDQAGDSARAQMKLGTWCAAQGMIDESRAHYASALRRDPNLPEAWRRLGYKFHEDRWVNETHEAHAKRQFTEAKLAYQHWKTRLARLARARSKPETKPEADKELDTIKDPQAAPAIWSVFVSGGERYHNIAARLFEGIDGPEGTCRLALLALFENEFPVRHPATDALARRDPREFVGSVIDYLRPPLKIEVREIGGPDMPGALIVDGQEVQEYLIPTFDQFRDGVSPSSAPAVNPNAFAANPRYYIRGAYHYTVAYQPPDPAVVQAFQMAAMNPGTAAMSLAGLASAHHAALPSLIFNVAVPTYHSSASTSTSASRAAARNAERALKDLHREYDHEVNNVKLQLKNAAAALERYNARLQEVKAHALEVLQAVTGLSLGDDQAAWGEWWAGWNATEGHSPAYNGDAPAPPAAPSPADKLHRSRLVSGTTVWTDRGRRGVETLRVGDRVLTQDTHTGALSYASVVDTTRAINDDLLRVSLADRDALTVTPLERLWRAGHGWIAASNLKTGDAVRTLDGAVKVVGVEALPAQPSYNVALSEGSALFAGDLAVLAHDNGVVRPLASPFDAVPSLDPGPAVDERAVK